MVKFGNALTNILRQDEIQEGLKVRAIARQDLWLVAFCPFSPRQGRARIGNVCQHIEKIAFLGVDDACHLPQLLPRETAFFQALQQRFAGVRPAPKAAKLRFILEELRQLAKKGLDELLGGNGFAACIPEAGRTDVLDRAFLAIRQLDFQPPRLLFLVIVVIGLFRLFFSFTFGALRLRGFRFERLAIPFGIVEMLIGLHEIDDREIILALVQTGRGPDSNYSRTASRLVGMRSWSCRFR